MGLRPLLYGILMWSVLIYALCRGGWAERLAAAAMVVGAYLTVLVVSPMSIRFADVEWSILAVDSSMFMLFMFMMLRSDRFWPIWFTAVHGVNVLCHFAPLFPGASRYVSANATALWGYPQLILLGAAIYRNAGKRKVRVKG